MKLLLLCAISFLDWNVDFVVIVVVHQRAKSEDFYPDVLNRRSQILRQLFADSKLDVNGSVSLGGMRRFGFIYPCSTVNYIPLAEMKPRPKSDVQSNLGRFSR